MGQGTQVKAFMSSTDEHPFDARYKHVLDNHGFGLRFSAGAEFAAEREASRILAHVEQERPSFAFAGVEAYPGYHREVLPGCVAILAESLTTFCQMEGF